jgi:DNA-binding MurR/RpiR family transcriptional regulator
MSSDRGTALFTECPAPLTQTEEILLGHGSGGKLTAQLIERIILPAFQNPLLARPRDVALGISTSGASANVNRALKRARELGLLTIGFAGRDGGRMPELCDHCFTVPSWSIHRVQESHTVLLHLLWDLLHVALGEDDVI